MTVTAAPSAHRGGVAVFYRDADHFAIEDLSLHVLKVISSQMVTGRRRWNIVGSYIFPSDASIIEDAVAAIRA